MRCGQPDSGLSTGARQNSTSSPRALRSDNCRESDVEVLIGTCRSKPPVEIPESGVIRKADSGARSNTAHRFARARFHPHPSPLPQAGEGARPAARSMDWCDESSMAIQVRKKSKILRKNSRIHISRSREMPGHEQREVPNHTSYENTDSRRLSERRALRGSQ